MTSQHTYRGGGRIELDMFVGGRAIGARSGARYSVFDPATGAIVGEAPLAGCEDAADAVAVAKGALGQWRSQPVGVRCDLVERALEAVQSAIPELATLLTREQGKPMAEAEDEIIGFVRRMRSFSRLARSSSDGQIPALPSMRAAQYGLMKMAEPAVTVALVAWNFPIGLMAKKIGPTLLAGGTAIVKPAFTTPLTALRVVSLMNAAGLPSGVLNCVTGRGDSVGEALASLPNVSRVHLSGGDATGERVKKAAGDSGANVLLDLGGSDAMIVCADADLEGAVEGSVVGRFRNAGQVCIAVKRLFVCDEIYSEFLIELCRRVRQIETGHGLTPAQAPRVRMGPLHTAEQRSRIEEQVADAIRRGAEVPLGGYRSVGAGTANGHFFEPTVVTKVPEESRLLREEVFGPVLPVVAIQSLEEGIERANRSPWNLNTSIWTGNTASVANMASRCRSRQLWVNRLPFGGHHEN